MMCKLLLDVECAVDDQLVFNGTVQVLNAALSVVGSVTHVLGSVRAFGEFPFTPGVPNVINQHLVNGDVYVADVKTRTPLMIEIIQ